MLETPPFQPSHPGLTEIMIQKIFKTSLILLLVIMSHNIIASHNIIIASHQTDHTVCIVMSVTEIGQHAKYNQLANLVYVKIQ